MLKYFNGYFSSYKYLVKDKFSKNIVGGGREDVSDPLSDAMVPYGSLPIQI